MKNYTITLYIDDDNLATDTNGRYIIDSIAKMLIDEYGDASWNIYGYYSDVDEHKIAQTVLESDYATCSKYEMRYKGKTQQKKRHYNYL